MGRTKGNREGGKAPIGKKGMIAAILTVAVTVMFAGTVVHSTDTRENMEGQSVILYTGNTDTGVEGIANLKMAGGLKSYFEEKNATVYLLDIGNTFFNEDKVRQEGERRGAYGIIKVMNEAGYDAMVPGQRDLEKGVHFLKDVIYSSETPANFPILCANVIGHPEEKPIYPEAGIIDENGVRIGFIGVTAYDGKRQGKATIEDMATAAARNVKDLKNYSQGDKQGVDYIVTVLSQGGKDQGREPARTLMKGAPGVDIILDGNSLTEYAPEEQGDSVLTVGMGASPRGVGYIRIYKDGRKTTGVITREAYRALTETDY